MDKRFYWLQERVEQGEFRVFWAPGKYNLADYFTKYHSPATHRKLRPIYIYIEGKSPTSLQGCIEILTSTDRPCPYSNNKPIMQGTSATNSNYRVSQPSSYQNTTLHKLIEALRVGVRQPPCIRLAPKSKVTQCSSKIRNRFINKHPMR